MIKIQNLTDFMVVKTFGALARSLYNKKTGVFKHHVDRSWQWTLQWKKQKHAVSSLFLLKQLLTEILYLWGKYLARIIWTNRKETRMQTLVQCTSGYKVGDQQWQNTCIHDHQNRFGINPIIYSVFCTAHADVVVQTVILWHILGPHHTNWVSLSSHLVYESIVADKMHSFMDACCAASMIIHYVKKH